MTKGMPVDSMSTIPTNCPPSILPSSGGRLETGFSGRLQKNLLEDEASFYGAYSWSLNPLLSVQEGINHLREELRRLDSCSIGWQRDEVITNVFLLGGMVAAAADDYIAGTRYGFSKLARVLPILSPALAMAAKLQEIRGRLRALRLRELHQWRQKWQTALVECLLTLPGIRSVEEISGRPGAKLSYLLPPPFTEELMRQRPRIPGAFRSKDLTHYDIIRLGEKFEAEFPDRKRPLLVIGLRTAGSFFAIVLCTYLKARGFENIRWVTLRSKKGIAHWEAQALALGKEGGALALVIDEHPNTGVTLAKTADLLGSSGFDDVDVVYLFPIHPAHPNWREVLASRGLSSIRVLHLEPEEWHKYRLLHSESVKTQLNEYFHFRNAHMQVSTSATRENDSLANRSDEPIHARLKRVYKVRLEGPAGNVETRFILAKSVGWGWLSYHAFLAGDRLLPFVPTILGLRDGILFEEWLPQVDTSALNHSNSNLVNIVASYIAARVRHLPLEVDPSLELSLHDNHQGNSLLVRLLSRVYGRGSILKYPRLLHRVAAARCPFPTLIDGKWNRPEWVRSSSSYIKTDFEHHGMGKTELNVVDPAYDLASAILHLDLSPKEEEQLLNQYRTETRDTAVEERLFLNKVMAGAWEISKALDKLANSNITSRHEEFNCRYVAAWNFLVRHTARFCGHLCQRPRTIDWRSPVVFLDLDGVLDSKLFRFPSTTAAGIRAISLFHAHDFTLVANTARSLPEVKEYCEAYGFAGGIAEYGSVLWDEVASRENILLSSESLAELDAVRNALRQIPGIFVDDTYRYVVRTYMYGEKGTVPVPTTLIDGLLARCHLDRMTFHQTNMDTAIVVKGITKGSGLRALLDWVGNPTMFTAAVGDSDTDLSMFREVQQCYAPSQIWCRHEAERLGCRIAKDPGQLGLLSIARTLIHPDGGDCKRCCAGHLSWVKGTNVFHDLLEVADQKSLRRWLSILIDPMMLRAFRE
jgi:hydroxymethylpyrimidine pyrophosphatase-like HAD family hydrolase